MGQPLPTSCDDWVEGVDARIKQLPPQAVVDQEDPVQAARRAAQIERNNNEKMTPEDYKFLAILIGCIFAVIAVMLGIGYLGLWVFILREGAPYGVSTAPPSFVYVC